MPRLRIVKLTCHFPKKWHWRVSKPCAYSPLKRGVFINGKSALWQSTEFKHAIQCATAVAAGSGFFGGVYTWMLSYARTTLARTMGIVRRMGYRNSYRTKSSVSGASEIYFWMLAVSTFAMSFSCIEDFFLYLSPKSPKTKTGYLVKKSTFEWLVQLMLWLCQFKNIAFSHTLCFFAVGNTEDLTKGCYALCCENHCDSDSVSSLPGHSCCGGEKSTRRGEPLECTLYAFHWRFKN